MGKPWNGDYVFSSGDLVEDLTHNFFLETGARNNKLKVYEMVDHPAARALTGYQARSLVLNKSLQYFSWPARVRPT